MISFDQVLLLEEKVESAVTKIRQLQAENDALRNKCAELTNALSAKSERLTTYEQDQSKIETGIMNALSRLSAIENSILHSTGSSSTTSNSNQTNIQNIKASVQQVMPAAEEVQDNNTQIYNTQISEPENNEYADGQLDQEAENVPSSEETDFSPDFSESEFNQELPDSDNNTDDFVQEDQNSPAPEENGQFDIF